MDVLNFIELANREHDALTEYCNSLSTLSHALHSTNNARNNDNAVTDTFIYNDAPHRSTKNEQVEASLLNYIQALTNLQSCHGAIQEKYHKSTTMTITTRTRTRTMNNEHNISTFQRKLLFEHMELSRRVLTTCASTSSVGYGLLHENGLLKNLVGLKKDENWHEIRVVALVSYRASIQRLKREFDDD